MSKMWPTTHGRGRGGGAHLWCEGHKEAAHWAPTTMTQQESVSQTKIHWSSCCCSPRHCLNDIALSIGTSRFFLQSANLRSNLEIETLTIRGTDNAEQLAGSKQHLITACPRTVNLCANRDRLALHAL